MTGQDRRGDESRSITCLTLLNMTDRDVSNRFTSGTVPVMMVHEEAERSGVSIRKGEYMERGGNGVEGRERLKTRRSGQGRAGQGRAGQGRAG